MEGFANICIFVAVIAATALYAIVETNWSPKKYFITWIVILIGTLATTVISVVLALIYGNAEQIWALAWLLPD